MKQSQFEGARTRLPIGMSKVAIRAINARQCGMQVRTGGVQGMITTGKWIGETDLLSR